MNRAFGYRCEYCEGRVVQKRVAREAFTHKAGFVILEEILIGICDKCGNPYYSADTLHRVQQIATGKSPPKRVERVPVGKAN